RWRSGRSDTEGGNLRFGTICRSLARGQVGSARRPLWSKGGSGDGRCDGGNFAVTGQHCGDYWGRRSRSGRKSLHGQRGTGTGSPTKRGKVSRRREPGLYGDVSSGGACSRFSSHTHYERLQSDSLDSSSAKGSGGGFGESLARSQEGFAC